MDFGIAVASEVINRDVGFGVEFGVGFGMEFGVEFDLESNADAQQRKSVGKSVFKVMYSSIQMHISTPMGKTEIQSVANYQWRGVVIGRLLNFHGHMYMHA